MAKQNNCKESGKHLHPVHLNRKGGHVWVCLECETQIAGPGKLADKELKVLIIYLKEVFLKDKKG